MSLCCLILIASKGAIGAACMVLLTTFVFYIINMRENRRYYHGGLISVVFLLPSFALASRFFYNRIFSTNLIETLDARTILNLLAFDTFLENPLLGIGINSFSFYRVENNLWMPFVSINATVHNLFLLYLSEVGLVGLAIFLLIIIKALLTSKENIRSTNVLISSTNAAIFSAMMGFLFHSLFTWIYRRECLTFLVWLLFALVYSSRAISGKGSER